MIHISAPTDPVEVLNLVQDIWENKAKRRFEKIIAKLNHHEAPLPNWFFSVVTSDASAPNKIHRIFHPDLMSRLCSIYSTEPTPSAAKKIQDKKDYVLANCIIPLMKRWDELFEALYTYYEDPAPLQSVINAFRCMIHESAFTCGNEREILACCGQPGFLKPYRNSSYTRNYAQFTKLLSELPLSRTNETVRLLKTIASNTNPITNPYPAIQQTSYVRQILPICDQNKGLIQDCQARNFYISPRSKTVWKIIRILCNCDPANSEGYVQIKMKGIKWQTFFTGASVPKDKINKGFLGAKEFGIVAKLGMESLSEVSGIGVSPS